MRSPSRPISWRSTPVSKPPVRAKPVAASPSSRRRFGRSPSARPPPRSRSRNSSDSPRAPSMTASRSWAKSVPRWRASPSRSPGSTAWCRKSLPARVNRRAASTSSTWPSVRLTTRRSRMPPWPRRPQLPSNRLPARLENSARSCRISRPRVAEAAWPAPPSGRAGCHRCASGNRSATAPCGAPFAQARLECCPAARGHPHVRAAPGPAVAGG